MNDEQLLEWYKNNKNSKPTDMSDKDYELTMNKAVKVQQDKLLQDNYKNQQSAIVQQQKNAEQSASISNEKLLKYLGQKQQASGIASGQTSSDFINANNSYVTNRANIANSAAAQQTELLNNYNINKMQNETESYNNEIAILDKYRAREIEDEDRRIAEEERIRDNEREDKDFAMEEDKWATEKEAYTNESITNKQNSAYNEIMTIIESGAFNSVNELDKLFDMYKENLSDSQEIIVKYLIDYYRNNPQQQEIESETSGEVSTSAEITSGKQYIEYDNEEYQINKALDVTNEDIKESLYSVVKDVLGKNNPYDKTIENGTTIPLSKLKRANLLNAGYWEWWVDGAGAAYTKSDEYITYYDGEWYISQKR